jgi:hypothetical protein
MNDFCALCINGCRDKEWSLKQRRKNNVRRAPTIKEKKWSNSCVVEVDEPLQWGWAPKSSNFGQFEWFRCCKISKSSPHIGISLLSSNTCSFADLMRRLGGSSRGMSSWWIGLEVRDQVFITQRHKNQFVLDRLLGHGFYWPETGNQAPESNRGPVKRSCCMVKGSNPGPKKTSCPRGAQKDTQICARIDTDRAQPAHVKYNRSRT